MSNDTADQQFWLIADSFIAAANVHCESVRAAKVSAAMLYATARFNSYIIAVGATSQADMTARKEGAVKYLMGQYEQMLRENLSDYEANFDKYLPGKDT